MIKCKDCEYLHIPINSLGCYACKLKYTDRLWQIKWDGSMPKTSPVWCPLKIKKNTN